MTNTTERDSLHSSLGEAERYAKDLEVKLAAERKAWANLYALALDYQIHHEGIMWAWRDKASPDTIEALEHLRKKLLSACEILRKTSGLTKDQVAELSDYALED